jgi:Sulfotransferase family
VPSVVPVNESHFARHLVPAGHRPPGLGTANRQPAGGRALKDHVSYLLAEEYADAWRPKARELVLARLRAQAEAGARRLGLEDPMVVIKEPQGQGADVLMSFLPGARLLFLVRDGREVVRSMLAIYGPGGRLEEAARGPDPDSDKSRLRFVQRQSIRWVQRMRSVQAAFANHPPELRLMTRYEDLRRDTPAELRRLTDWMGLERTDEQLRAAVDSELSRKRPTGSGRRDDRDPSFWELRPPEREAAEEVMGPVLVELGYPV